MANAVTSHNVEKVSSMDTPAQLVPFPMRLRDPSDHAFGVGDATIQRMPKTRPLPSKYFGLSKFYANHPQRMIFKFVVGRTWMHTYPTPSLYFTE
jgi:hypothetical protein